MDQNENRQEEEVLMAQTIVEYFRKMFYSVNPPQIDLVVEAMKHLVSPDLNWTLLNKFSAKEVRKVVHPS